jgi:hypothetical protein
VKELTDEEISEALEALREVRAKIVDGTATEIPMALIEQVKDVEEN